VEPERVSGAVSRSRK